jgi:hypothetical protein
VSAPQWAGGGEPSFTVTVTPAEVLPLVRAAIVWPEDGAARIKLALALQWLEWKLNPEGRNDD